MVSQLAVASGGDRACAVVAAGARRQGRPKGATRTSQEGAAGTHEQGGDRRRITSAKWCCTRSEGRLICERELVQLDQQDKAKPGVMGRVGGGDLSRCCALRPRVRIHRRHVPTGLICNFSLSWVSEFRMGGFCLVSGRSRRLRAPYVFARDIALFHLRSFSRRIYVSSWDSASI